MLRIKIDFSIGFFLTFPGNSAFTALDALDLNYRVIVVHDACRGVDVKSIREQKETLISRGAILVNSKQVRV